MAEGFDKILVAIDGSDSALRAACFADGIADAMGMSIVLLRVLDPAVIDCDVLASVSNFDQREVLEMFEDQLNDPTQDPVFAAAREAMQGKCPHEERIVWGRPASVICQTAKDLQARQIVMGTRGNSAFKDLLIGSVSQQVVQLAECPVTIVR